MFNGCVELLKKSMSAIKHNWNMDYPSATKIVACFSIMRDRVTD
jgi:hypothetical protein